MIALATLLVLIAWLCQLESVRLGYRRLKSVVLDRDIAMPSISILKPVCGIEAGLESNLEAFFRLDYPDFEILVCSQRPDDPALDIARRLQLKYPQVRSRIIPEAIALGTNPKINTIGRAFTLAHYDWILISDANVRPDSNFLIRLAHGIAGGCDMQSGVLRGIKAKNWAGRVEALMYELFYAKAMWLLDATGNPCASAKCLFFRRSDAECFGGLEAIADYHADDVRLSRLMKQNGKRVALLNTPLNVYIGAPTWKAVWTRQVRWATNRKVLFLPGFLIEPLSCAFVSGALFSWVFSAATRYSALLGLALHLLVWAASDLTLLSRQKIPLGLITLVEWFTMEAFRIVVWLASVPRHHVNWRGNLFHLAPGGKMTARKVAT